MADENKVTQKDNVVLGDMAGRDINKYIMDPSKPRTAMTHLTEKYKKESKTDQVFKDRVKKLEHYCSQVANEEVIGLEAKLKLAGKENFLEFAEKTKEIFSKKIAEYQFSETAQRIHAYLLVHVYTKFQQFIYPELQNGISDQEIRKLIDEHIIKEIELLLEENVLDLYADEIHGMLYYLTGNCHIKWIK